MPVYVVAAALAVVLSVVLSIPLLWRALRTDRGAGKRVGQNLRAGLSGGRDLRTLVLSQPRVERILQPVLHFLASPARRLAPAGVEAALGRRIQLAGVDWRTERVLSLKVGLGGLLLGLGVSWMSRSPSKTTLIGAVAVAAIGWFGPDTVLARKARERQLAISNELADTLDQLTICVEAGLGFDAALARISRSGHGPLAGELTRLLQELRVGVPRAEALAKLLDRTDVPELRQFVHAVTQAETYGVPITRVLRAQAVEQREKRRFRAEERAMKLPVKVIFPLVFCILPTLFIVILGPALIRISGGLA